VMNRPCNISETRLVGIKGRCMWKRLLISSSTIGQDMTVLRFPPELWLHIASEGGLQRPEYRALVLVNKHFFNTFTHMLYSDLVISFPHPLNFPPIYNSASAFAMGGPRLEMLLDRLQSNEALRNYVRTCRIDFLQYSSAQIYRDIVSGHAGMYDTFGDTVIMSLLGTRLGFSM
jgi:hypothetical protein